MNKIDVGRTLSKPYKIFCIYICMVNIFYSLSVLVLILLFNLYISYLLRIEAILSLIMSDIMT